MSENSEKVVRIAPIDSGFNYDKELRETLAKDAWLRHLFNKINQPVVCLMRSGVVIRGILVAVHYARGLINLEINSGSPHFVNWRHVEVLSIGEEAEKTYEFLKQIERAAFDYTLTKGEDDE